MKRIINNIKRMMKGLLPTLLLVAGSQGITSCSDSWNDHYDQSQYEGSSSLLKLIEADPQLSDFSRLLKVTHIYNNQKRTNVTYAELLDADQTLTVWAPINGTYNIDSLMALCQTTTGDSTVSQHFVRNHIAHNLYNMNSQTTEAVKMLNDKYLSLTSSALYNSKVIDGKFNIPATNGLLHTVNDDAQYTYNIYEGITSMEEFLHIGKFLFNFERQELDEDMSIVAGIEDGKKIYSDSVMVKENILFRKFDQIMSEDSSFVMLMPSAKEWEPAFKEASKYFNYGSMEKADSISNYWTNVCMIQDLIFNKNEQRSMNDSIFTTALKYNKREWPNHVYYNPYNSGGYLDPANIKDSLLCSNGLIYRINKWPFTPEDLYFHPIIMEGEREVNLIDKKDCTTNYRQTIDPAISGGGYLDIVPSKSTSNWTAKFQIANTLSGTYDICIVTLPKTAYLSISKDTKPNKFKATLNYVDIDGSKKSVNFDDEIVSSGTNIDTLCIGRFTFPTCNYQQQDATVSLELKCSISNRQTSYSREMFLDCIYLRPVSEATETKSRKEARK